MTLLEQRQAAIVEEFNAFDDWMMKYEYIMELGRQLPSLPEDVRTDEHLMKGCQSKVWVRVTMLDGVLHIDIDSDALIVKGFAAIVRRLFEGLPPADVHDAQITVFHDIGLEQHISLARSNGLFAMLEYIRSAAAAYAIS